MDFFTNIMMFFDITPLKQSYSLLFFPSNRKKKSSN